MIFKKTGNKYIIRIDKGEELVDTLTNFCKKENIKLGSITGLGAADYIKLGIFVCRTKAYKSTEFRGDHEITALHGNISTMKGETYLHTHITIAGIDHKAYGGHLNAAIISGTFEGIIEVFEGEIDREFEPGVGLNLYKF